MPLPVLEYFGKVNTKAVWGITGKLHTAARGKKNREKTITAATESNSLAYTSQTDKWWEGQVMPCLKRKANMKPNAQGTRELFCSASTMSSSSYRQGERWTQGESAAAQGVMKTWRACFARGHWKDVVCIAQQKQRLRGCKPAVYKHIRHQRQEGEWWAFKAGSLYRRVS